MKNKYYTIFFASDRNQYSRSLKISRNGIILISFFGIFIIALSIIGLFTVTNIYTLNHEISDLEENYMILNNIISDLEYSMESDSTMEYEDFIKSFYSINKMDYPNIAPVEGYVTRGIQLDNNHLGIDIAAKYKDKVISPADGRVVYAGESEVFGKTIIINHLAGFVTVYGHNDTILVYSGEEVEKKQIIAHVGETGISQGPHLHYEIWKNNKIIDPREIVSEYKKKDVSISESRK